MVGFKGNGSYINNMDTKEKVFEDGMAYTIDKIAKELSRSSNYVDGRLTKVEPCAEIATEAGPYARGWSGMLLNDLVSKNVLSKTLPAGTIVWKNRPNSQRIYFNINDEIIK